MIYKDLIMTFKPGHDICLTCKIGPLKGIERLVGICYTCNRNSHKEFKLSESPKYEFSNDEGVKTPKLGNRRIK